MKNKGHFCFYCVYFGNKQKVFIFNVYSFSGSFPGAKEVIAFKVPKISWQQESPPSGKVLHNLVVRVITHHRRQLPVLELDLATEGT